MAEIAFRTRHGLLARSIVVQAMRNATPMSLKSCSDLSSAPKFFLDEATAERFLNKLGPDADQFVEILEG